MAAAVDDLYLIPIPGRTGRGSGRNSSPPTKRERQRGYASDSFDRGEFIADIALPNNFDVPAHRLEGGVVPAISPDIPR